MTDSPKRINSFEWLRALACVAVVLIHVSEGVMASHAVSEAGLPRAAAWALGQVVLCRWAVPVFFMMSGALLLDPGKGAGWGRVRRYASRMAGVLATFGLAFCLMEAVMDGGGLSPAAVAGALANLLAGRSWAHMWYVYALLGIYLLLPAIHAYAASASRRDLRVALCVLFCCTLVAPTVGDLSGVQVDTLIWVTSSVFWFVLGRYAWEWLRLDGRMVALGIASVVATCVMQFAALSAGSWGNFLRSPSFAIAAPWALLVFLAAKERLEREPPRPVLAVARLSFGVYLLHPVFLNVMQKVLLWVPWEGAWASTPPLAFEAVEFAIAFAGSLAVSALLRRVPGFRRLI